MLPPVKDAGTGVRVSGPRYFEEQDSRENGLDLLREQYQVAYEGSSGRIKANWKLVSMSEARVCVGDAVFTIKDPNARGIAILICRAIHLGRRMMDELEPGTANASENSELEHAGGNA